MFVFTENDIHDYDNGVNEEHTDEEDGLVKLVELYKGREGYNADNPDMNQVLEAVRFVGIV